MSEPEAVPENEVEAQDSAPPGWLARHALPGTSLLAWRNLAHDRARFFVTLVGIVFSVVLMGAQCGLLVGFAQTASTLIDHTRADLWITAVGTTNVDIAAGLPKRWVYQARGVPGVAQATPYTLQFAFWRKPTGGNESVIMVGVDLASGHGRPWNLVAGSVEDLQSDGAVILDRLYMEKLGVQALGQTVEINNRRARVVGFTSGIRTFTQSPYVFTTEANAHHFTFLSKDDTTYVLVQLAPGVVLDDVKQALQQRVGERARVWTRAEFARQTQRYWLVTTGAGAALLLAATLGLVVGVVIVGQTLYATTVDRLPEYATLRAMGAPNRYLYTVILKQAAISAALGYAFGLVAVLALAGFMRDGNIALSLPPMLMLLLAVLTALMCALGAIVSIRRVLRIDPTSVFA